jgi:hypothetical protein
MRDHEEDSEESVLEDLEDSDEDDDFVPSDDEPFEE